MTCNGFAILLTMLMVGPAFAAPGTDTPAAFSGLDQQYKSAAEPELDTAKDAAGPVWEGGMFPLDPRAPRPASGRAHAHIDFATDRTFRVHCGNGGLGVRIDTNVTTRSLQLVIDGEAMPVRFASCNGESCNSLIGPAEFSGLQSGDSVAVKLDGKEAATIPLTGSARALEPMIGCPPGYDE